MLPQCSENCLTANATSLYLLQIIVGLPLPLPVLGKFLRFGLPLRVLSRFLRVGLLVRVLGKFLRVGMSHRGQMQGNLLCVYWKQATQLDPEDSSNANSAKARSSGPEDQRQPNQSVSKFREESFCNPLATLLTNGRRSSSLMCNPNVEPFNEKRRPLSNLMYSSNSLNE